MAPTGAQLKLVCDSLRNQSAPFVCPIGECGRSYKTLSGIQFHICNTRHEAEAITAACERARSPRKDGKESNNNHSGSSPNVKENSNLRGVSDSNKNKANKLATVNGNNSQVVTPARRDEAGAADMKAPGRADAPRGAIGSSPLPGASLGSGAGQPREGLTYAEAQKVVEIDVDGGLYRLNIEEPLSVILSSEANLLGHRPEGARQPDKPRSPHKTAKSKKARSSKAGAKMAGAPEGGARGAGALPVRLPEAVVSLVEDYECSDAPERPSTYYRFTEKTPEELDEMVEYDMDEEDTAWLEIINRKRKKQGIQSEVTGDTFELLMDRLEKESYFQAQNAPPGGSGGSGSAIDDDAVCAICQDGECHNANAILFCDMCNLAVHQECYGVPYIPEGQWLCRRCLQSPSRAVDCVLCPNRGGAFKQTSDGKWGHVVCALWVPEVYFANTVFLEPIDNICNIPAARWKLTCYICKKRGQGACIQCHKANCYTAFHVTCAQQAGLYMKLEECKSGEQSGVRKTAFCDSHAPVTYKKADKMRSARKILQERAKALPVVSIPTIPEERMMHVASLVSLPRKADFLQRLVGYWTLKRQSRNGVSLLRRLQMSHLSSRHNRNEPDLDGATAAMRDQLKYWQRLRQDLERARLLCELIRKREKLKREHIRLRERHFLAEISPLPKALNELISLLQEKDPHKIFAEPVDTHEVTDYLTLIKEPMDFSTMQTKVNNLEYRSFADVEKDFNLIVSNCMTYNAKDTIFYKAAVKLRDRGGAIIRAHRENLSINFDYDTGRLRANPLASSGTVDSKVSSSPTGSATPHPAPNATRASQRRSDAAAEAQQLAAAKANSLNVQDFLRSVEYRALNLQSQVNAVKSRQQMLTLEDASPFRAKYQRLLRCELVKLRRKLVLEKKTNEVTADADASSREQQHQLQQPKEEVVDVKETTSGHDEDEESGTESDSTVETDQQANATLAVGHASLHHQPPHHNHHGSARQHGAGSGSQPQKESFKVRVDRWGSRTSGTGDVPEVQCVEVQ